MSTPNVEPIVPVDLPELRYEYQPTDEQGRPLGGKQVIIYRTPDELAEKLSKQNVELIRKLRTVTREQRLGIQPNEAIPDEAERFDSVTEFKPRDLSAEERYQLSQDLNDPEKFVDARNRLFESAVGAPPEKLTTTLNEQQMYIKQLQARENYADFARMKIDSGYLDVVDNRKVLVDWMLKHRLAPSIANFNLAYAKLKEAGLLLEAPVVQQEPTPAPAPVEVPVPVDTGANPQPSADLGSRIATEGQPQAKRPSHVPSGLNNSNSSTSGGENKPNTSGGYSLTLAEIDKLTPDQLKKNMSDPKFRQHWDNLLDEAAKKRRERQSQ